MEKKPSLAQKTDDEIKPSADAGKKTKFSFSEIKKVFNSKPTKQQILIIGGVVLGIAALIIATIFVINLRKPDPVLEPIVVKEESTEPIKPVTVASKLAGVQVLPELNERPVTGIMIENSVDARPQAGLLDAEVVFEAIAEGGITRFLTLFQVNQPEYIGPIRSARPYYVQWAAGFDASYAHSGGSGEALALIRSLGMKDMDHGNYPSYFDRVSNRYAPHNVYTSMARLDSLRESKGYTTSTFEEFARIAPLEEETETTVPIEEAVEEVPVAPKPKANSISFNISSPLYNTSYTYDAVTNTYPRVMAGQPHLDERSGLQIKPSVVIALVTSFGYHPDGVHNTYTVVGSGSVFVFQNGEVIEGNWSKASPTASLKLTDAAGTPLELQPGQTWITAIPSGRVSHTP